MRQHGKTTATCPFQCLSKRKLRICPNGRFRCGNASSLQFVANRCLQNTWSSLDKCIMQICSLCCGLILNKTQSVENTSTFLCVYFRFCQKSGAHLHSYRAELLPLVKGRLCIETRTSCEDNATCRRDVDNQSKAPIAYCDSQLQPLVGAHR